MTRLSAQSGATRARTLRARAEKLWRKHRRAFWIAHSIWALTTGAAVIALSRERYGFVPWVVGFLVLTWASTLLFSRREGGERSGRRFGNRFASYLTRVLYQETLFFLLPFYAYSTVFPSWGVLFLVLLACLAILACLDLLFDRWLQNHRLFGLLFFAVVAFAALNLLLPLLIGLPPDLATGIAALLALGSAVPLAVRGATISLAAWLRVGTVSAGILAVAFLAPGLVPPVPLRLEHLTFGTGFDEQNFAVTGVLGRSAKSDPLDGALVALAEVFAPSNVPARVALEWSRNGEILRTSREMEILAHRGGFRVWDAYRPEDAPLRRGSYRIVLRTADGRAFGAGSIHLR